MKKIKLTSNQAKVEIVSTKFGIILTVIILMALRLFNVC